MSDVIGVFLGAIVALTGLSVATGLFVVAHQWQQERMLQERYRHPPAQQVHIDTVQILQLPGQGGSVRSPDVMLLPRGTVRR